MSSRDFDDVTSQPEVDEDEDMYDDWSDNCCCCCCSGQCASSRTDCLLDLDIHGISRINRTSPAGTSPPLRRCVWLTVLLTSLVAFIYCTVDCVDDYTSRRRHHTGTSQQQQKQWRRNDDDDALLLYLPPIMLCNLNPIRMTEAERRNWPVMSREQDGSVDFAAWNGVNASSFEVLASGAHLLDNMLISCQVPGSSCSAFNFSRTLTEAGTCYSIHPVNASRMSLTLNVEAYEYTPLAQHGVGLRLLVDVTTDARRQVGLASRSHAGVLLAPGTRAEVTVQQRHVSHDVESLRCSDVIAQCISGCRSDVIQRHCGCRPYWMPIVDVKLKTCNIREHFGCVVHKLDAMELSGVDCSHCGTPCSSHPAAGARYTTIHSHSRLTTSSVAPATGCGLCVGAVVNDSRLAAMVTDRCHARGARARLCPRTAASDWALATRFVDAVAALDAGVRQLRTGVDRAETGLGDVIEDLQRRVAFHVRVGLAALRKSFVRGFEAAFKTVRERSLLPLVADGGYETVANLERTVKQLTFTSLSETVARKILYYVADNQLSGKLETAIQALDNITKTYYSFVNAEPRGASVTTEPRGTSDPVTPGRRYDAHVVPYGVLEQVQPALRTCYDGVSENVAGLIEHILTLKATIKDVFDKNTVNQSSFELTCRSFVQRTQQVRHFTSAFEREVVAQSLALIDSRIEHIQRLNRSLTSHADDVTTQLTHLRHVLDTYTHAHDDIRSLSRLAAQLGSPETVAVRQTLSEQTGSDVTRSAMTSLLESAETLRHDSDAVLGAWQSANSTVSDLWRTMMDDDALRNFYLHVYNDVSDVTSQADVLEALLVDGGLQVPPGGLAAYRPQQLYSLFNADVPVIDAEVRMTEVADNFRRFQRQTNARRTIGARDRALTVAFNSLAGNMAAFTASCQLSPDLIMDNVVVVDISTSLAPSSVLTTSPAYSLSTLLGHVGGLLALFLGASLITGLELFDVILHCACAMLGSRRRTDSNGSNRNRNLKLPPGATGNASNHVMFRPVASESLDDDEDVTYLPYHRACSLNTPNMTSPARVNVPKVKVNSTTFRGSASKQAETDI